MNYNNTHIYKVQMNIKKILTKKNKKYILIIVRRYTGDELILVPVKYGLGHKLEK